MKIAVLSNTNMEPLQSFLKDSVFSGFNQYMIQMMPPYPLIEEHQPDLVWIHLDAKEFAGDFYHDALKGFEPVYEKTKDLSIQLSHAASQYENIVFIISLLCFPPDSYLNYLGQNDDYDLIAHENQINAQIKHRTRNNTNVLYFDFKTRILLAHGAASIFDNRFWYLGRIMYSPKGLRAMADELTHLHAAHMGKQKKVLVLDLDNTLWGGVIGEDGINGIQLSEEGEGKAFRDFQKEIKAQKNLGVLLAICSKNNYEDAMEAINHHPMMVLEEDDFIIKKINWENKAQNINQIAQELNLGLESFVFIDDNPVEREMVATALKQVSVPDFPENPMDLPDWFLHQVVYPNFAKLTLTEEDKYKTDQYKKNVQRKEMSAQLDIKTFIKNLDIQLRLHIDHDPIINRLAQLTQKTNQFNLTTRRYTENDIQAFINSPDSRVYAIEYEDKFGKEGIIGEIILKFKGKTAVIDVFLLSCRVLGRDVEFDFFKMVLNDIQTRADTIAGEYMPTAKNDIVKNLYPTLGLNTVPDETGTFTGNISKILKKES